MTDLSEDLRELASAEQKARQALAEPAKDWYSVTTAAKGKTKTGKINIYDTIGGWMGVSASKLIEEINALDVGEIEVHLNSPGGAAYDSIAIYNSLRKHRAVVHVTVDGLAASGGSLIAMAGDKVTMAIGSQMMIHSASGLALGQADDMRKLAEVLDKMDDSQATIYTAKAGGEKADWRQAMARESWYTAEEAVDAGLADELDVAVSAEDARIAAAFDLSIFAYAGRDKAPPPVSTQSPDATADGQPKEGQDDNMSDTLVAALRETLGLTDDKSEDDILAEVKAKLTPPPDNPGEKSLKPDQLQALAEASGAVLVDATVWQNMQAQMAELGKASVELRNQKRDALITAAMEDGRIPPQNREQYEALYDKAPEQVTAMIGKLQKNLVPVEARGYGDEAIGGDEDDMGQFSPIFRASHTTTRKAG